MQIDLWGNPIRSNATYYFYHDESIPNKQWLLIGLVLVREQDLDTAREELTRCRQVEEYYGEIHFSQLPARFDGKWGARARVARAWMQLYERTLCDKVFCSILCVDRASPRFEHQRFTREFHAYNRFTAMAVKAAVSWHLRPQQFDDLNIHFVSDAKDRATRLAEQEMDNFETYIPYRAELDAYLAQAEGRSYTSIKMALEQRNSADDDLLQLCDLLLGATQMALVAGSRRATKRELGSYIVRWCEDLRKPPWQQSLGLHRKLNIWAFPDTDGKPYNNPSFALPLDSPQQGLLSLE